MNTLRYFCPADQWDLLKTAWPDLSEKELARKIMEERPALQGIKFEIVSLRRVPIYYITKGPAIEITAEVGK